MVPLPHLDLSYQRDPKTMELVTGSQLPTSIFIKVEREEGGGWGGGREVESDCQRGGTQSMCRDCVTASLLSKQPSSISRDSESDLYSPTSSLSTSTVTTA